MFQADNFRIMINLDKVERWNLKSTFGWIKFWNMAGLLENLMV